MNCQDIATILNESSVAEMGAARRSAVDRHLSRCSDCAHAWMAQEALVNQSVPDAAPELLSRTMELFTDNVGSTQSGGVLFGWFVTPRMAWSFVMLVIVGVALVIAFSGGGDLSVTPALPTGQMADSLGPEDALPEPVVVIPDLPASQVPGSLEGGQIVALSPDGRQFVYNTIDGLYLRTVGELESRLIPGTGPSLSSPVFSPDGQSLAYRDASGRLARIAINGGAPVFVADGVDDLFGLGWEADGTIVFARPAGIFRVSANGGTPELIIPAGAGMLFYSPELLPDGDSVLFTARPLGSNSTEGRIMVQSLSTGQRTIVLQGGGEARYLPTGHLVYALDDELFAVAFDADTLTVSGETVSLVQGLLRIGAGGFGNYAVSRDGDLVYVRANAAAVARSLVWVDREGREEPLSVPPRAYTSPRISPDGTKVALNVNDQEQDIWIWDFARQTLTRLTFNPGQDRFPVWSPDGRRIAFSTSRGGGAEGDTDLFWRPADGTGSPERLLAGSSDVFPASFLPDATGVLVFGSLLGEGNDDIAVLRMDGERTTTPLLATPFRDLTPELSPDGRWLAYASDESGRQEIYVRPFPDINAGRWQVSTGGGMQPLWARSGQELFYRDGGAVMAVPVEMDPSFAVGYPQVLFQGPYATGSDSRSYDVSPDGGRFLMIKEARDTPTSAQIIVVLNWVSELQRLVPTG